MTNSDSTVAIIGTGNIGGRLAANFAAGGQDSSGQILAGLLPTEARLVKAFGTLSAGTLSAAARREPERAVQFYAADDDAAGDLVADLIRTGGCEPVHVGGLDQSVRIEMFGDLHEYGALGSSSDQIGGAGGGLT
jgi:8-hydroxy-5-deazaflavin:NADPH oxidoreductase